jgi:hypothetical protein
VYFLIICCKEKKSNVLTIRQFHQRFTRSFFVQNFGAKAKTSLEKWTFVQKKGVKNVDEIDTMSFLTELDR